MIPIPPILLRPLLYAAIALALLAAGFAAGGLYVSGKWRAAEAARAVQAVKIVTRQGAATERVVVRWKERQAGERVVTETQIKEVLRYVPPAADPVLPLGWRLLHNAAAAGAVPQAPAGADVAAGDTQASAAAQAVVGNYGTCRVTAAQLEALQDWVRGMYETTNLEPLRYPAQ